ncbi:hypothetical protein [Ramlibacter sp. Leaf400]|uniref:hypothetical protein n=1 Tax=Ramlibacter sp. Leaf400 TaxID=1736365 RepID=UPI0009E84583|nr:hypothetical protein [Ramlibacter sp. Leaf400]
MKKHLAFLHTSPVHVETFEALVKTSDPSVTVDHVVREDLLQQARELGADHPAVVQLVHGAILDAAQAGATLVVCTCSTIGGLAERAPTPQGVEAARIDRAMADRAVSDGGPVLVVTALRSTVAPTTALLQESANRIGSDVGLEVLCVEDAWQLFEEGDRAGYLNSIASAITSRMRGAAAKPRVVVLAQASMAPVSNMLPGVGVDVLASPALGVEAAITRLRLLEDSSAGPPQDG